jgi:ribosome biogenesis protein SSF1/2
MLWLSSWTVFAVFVMYESHEMLSTLLQGPTLTLRIKSYSLMRDVIAAQARPRMPQNAFKTPPLLVMNQFKGHGQHLQLAGTLFQAMFPALQVGSVKLASCNVSSRPAS